MSVPKKTTWQIESHTKAKHKILENYLKAWFPILNKYHGRIIYLDGFCGPGIYSAGESGSPIIALDVAANHRKTLSGEIVFIFIDERSDRIENLSIELGKLKLPNHFRTILEVGKFHDILTNILDGMENKGELIAPTFVFIDPFGFSGLPFKIVERLLRIPRVEVFITFMVDAINRFIEVENNSQQIVDLFGSKDVLDLIKNSTNREKDLRLFYQEQLKKHARYVRYFQMCDTSNKPIYYLFFASNNDLGHLKMKEAMWKVDKEGFYKFSDATDQNQVILFRNEPYEELYQLLNKNRSHEKYEVKQIRKYVEDETPYLVKHLKGALKNAEENNLIVVEDIKSSGERRKGKTFPDDVIINF